jgi:hypothetical protein
VNFAAIAVLTVDAVGQPFFEIPLVDDAWLLVVVVDPAVAWVVELGVVVGPALGLELPQAASDIPAMRTTMAAAVRMGLSWGGSAGA